MRPFARPAGSGWAPFALALLAASPAAAQDVSLEAGASTDTGTAAAATATPAPEAAPAAAAPVAEPASAVVLAPPVLHPIDDPATQERERWRKQRAGSTYFGPVGGIYVVDAGSGLREGFRLQLMTDFFVKKDFLYSGDTNRYTGGVLSLGVTPLEFLELSAAVTTRSNSNTKTEPQVLQANGDLHFDVKGFVEPVDGFTLGADARVTLLNAPGDVGVDFSGTSFGLRANFALDLRELADDVPLQLRLNAGHYFDQTTEMVQDLEQRRFDNLVAQGLTSAESRHEEYRHLLRRDERFALGINRADRTTIAVGVEAPLEVNDDFAIHPIAEWELDIPSNRRSFDCPYVVDSSGNKLAGTDSCLDQEGVDTWPQRVTVGARWYPWLRGLSVLTGVEIGIGGVTNFVEELAPQAPYKVLLALGYAADLKPRREVREVEKRVEVPVAPPTGHVRGSIVEQGQGTAVADARVSFSGSDLNPIVATADGKFVSYPFPPGAVAMSIEAEGYQPGECAATIAPAGGDVDATCELVALPRVGTISGQVRGDAGAALANVNIALTGPEARTLSSDPTGAFRAEALPPGDYSARIEQQGYLISVTPLNVKVRAETQTTIQLIPMPKASSVQIKKDRLAVKGTIFFATDTANIEERSEPLLTEIADTMIRHPELLKVEVQGHTDNTGTPEHNQELSDKRAQAVKDWLASAGVERDRLYAKGYGADKPLVPNVTPQGRSRNRRVEFVITERASEPAAAPAPTPAAKP
jgi:OOP family OmpA-OmpF porin